MNAGHRADPQVRAINSEVSLEYIRKLRDVTYSEKIYELLAKQYEAARLDEAKNTSVIQVMDKAVEHENKSKQHRGNMVILSAMAAGFLATLLAFFMEENLKTGSDDSGRAKCKAYGDLVART